MKEKLKILSEWLDKIEKTGIPNEQIYKMMWPDVISILRSRIKEGHWQRIVDYIQKNKTLFAGEQTMVGPACAKVVFNQISQKIWSINKKVKQDE